MDHKEIPSLDLNQGSWNTALNIDEAYGINSLSPLSQDVLNSLPNLSVGVTGSTTGAISGNAIVNGSINYPNWNITTTNNTGGYAFHQPSTIMNGGTIELNGSDPDIKIGNKSLRNWMEKVEERLNILTPSPEMEKEWDELRRLGERYRKLEKKCQEKAQVWKKLKSMPAVKE